MKLGIAPLWGCHVGFSGLFYPACERSSVLASRKGVSSRSYVGCIKNLEISRSTFDLLRNSYGVRKGCALEVGSKHCRGGLDGFL